uniref:Uncharacterized protein n=1 Tax=viral metagenome TaxID=1070528 RepID=A0A6C0DGJ6_9ZZZZ
MICTYYYYDPELKKKIPKELIVSNLDFVEEQDDDICDLIYQTDYLQIFGVVEFDYKTINTEMKRIYETDGVKTNARLQECMKKVANMFLSEDLELGFMALFSYDYLFLTHLCICDVLENGSIQEKHLNLLTNLVFQEK